MVSCCNYISCSAADSVPPTRAGKSGFRTVFFANKAPEADIINPIAINLYPSGILRNEYKTPQAAHANRNMASGVMPGKEAPRSFLRNKPDTTADYARPVPKKTTSPMLNLWESTTPKTKEKNPDAAMKMISRMTRAAFMG